MKISSVYNRIQYRRLIKLIIVIMIIIIITVIITNKQMVCNIGQINDRNDYKKRKYLNLRLGPQKLYPDYEIK